MAFKTNLTVNHDYLTVRVSFTKESRVNLTINHWGPKATATVDLAPQFNQIVSAFEKLWRAKKFGDNLKFMEAVKAAGDKSTDPDMFIFMLTELRG